MLYLASTSPRRRQLLEDAGIDYAAVPPGPEPSGAGDPADRARQRAASKAEGAVVTGPPGWILGVDTVVELEGRELGKPADEAAARRGLEQLAGAVHRVHTALCLVSHPKRERFAVEASATVRCRPLESPRLAAYLASGAWRGKAGGYGLQDEACDFMEVVEGDPNTVIGLPVASLTELLARVGEATA